MKRFWTMLMVVAVALVMALPAGAVKPPKPPKPPKPSTSVPIAMFVDAQPVWVHEGADLLRYTVKLENKTSTDITDVTVEFTAAGATDFPLEVNLPANDTVTLEEFSRFVSEFPEAANCGIDDECPLVARATVIVDGDLVAQTDMSIPLMPVPPCGFTYHYTNELDFVSNSVQVSDLCIWTLPEDGGVLKTGIWEITLTPTPPNNPKRPIGASVTVRDGVPGNWCPLAIGLPSGISERWTFGDDLPTGQTYLPGDEDILGLGLAEGMCINGGAGGDYFEVGNPKSFYLAADGTVTVKWVRPLP